MKNVIAKIGCSLALLLVVVHSAFGGNWKNFSNYMQATCIANRGNEIWVSDKSGLVMYDKSNGSKTYFRKSPTELPSLMVERVQVNALTGDIWIGTYDNGLAMLHNNTWTHIPFPATDALMYEMKIAADGSVWSATDKGLYHYKNGNFDIFFTGQNSSPWDIDIMPNGKILCGSHQPFIFDPLSLAAQQVPSTVIAYGFSRVIAEDDHHFFFSTDHSELAEFTDTIQTDTFEISYANDMQWNANGHLLLLDQENILHEKTDSTFHTLAFGNNALTAFLAMANGEMWGAGTTPYNQLLNLNLQNQTVQIDMRQCDLADNRVSEISRTEDGTVLIVAGYSLQKFDLNTQTFSTIPLDSAMQGSMNEVLEANGKIYAGSSYKHFYEYTNVTGWQQKGNGILPHPDVKHFDTDASGNLWMCGYGFVAKYDGTNFTVYDASDNNHLNQYIRDIHCDRTRNLVWFCSYDGIFKLDNGTISFYNDSTAGIQQYYDAVETIEEDAAHNIWFGTVYGGILKYNGSVFSTMLLPETVGNQFVSDFAFVGGVMYVSDNLHGVWKYEGAQWDSFNVNNSPLTDKFVTSLHADANGNLWIGNAMHGIDLYNKDGVTLSVSPVKNALNVAAYPNPSAAKFFLNWTGNESADIAIYSSDVRLVTQKQNALSGVAIDLGKPTSGLYIAEVKTKTSLQQFKLLVNED